MCSGALQNNLNDLKSKGLWRAGIAELLGTGFLTFLGCASCLGSSWGNPPNNVQISLTFGLAVASVVHCTCHVSGGHVNPAVTCSMLVTRRITLVRAIVYVVMQCLGAVLGALLVRAITPHGLRESLGLTSVNSAIDAFPHGLIVEALITFVLVWVVFAACDPHRSQGGSVPLTIGFAVALCHFVAIKYTGSSMNPARTFGPALVGGNWDDHWVYWLGPIIGGVLAGLIYDFFFAENASPTKLTRFLSAGYDADKRYDLRDAGSNEMVEVRHEQKKMIDNL